MPASPRCLFDKIWDAHEVADALLYIDLHLVHEVTSPQAFESLRMAGRAVRRPDRTLATADHNVPTDGSTTAAQIRDQLSRVQVETLEENCRAFGVPIYSIGSARQGIVHVIGPEIGVTQPGMTIVCGDSHTSTHGAFGALAFGIGTSEVEHVLATQTLQQRKPRSMRIRYEGELGYGVTAKDLILSTIGRIGVAGGVGHVIEYAGPPIEGLSMEGRMTVCNMTIEAGGRAGMIAPDDTTFEWVEGREAAPDPLPLDEWRELRTDDGAEFDTEVEVDASELSPQVTWGTTPGMVTDVTGAVPEPRNEGEERALEYMALAAGTPVEEIRLDRVFIGSCTNSRIGDLREAAEVVRGHRVAGSVSRDGRAGVPAGQGRGRGRGSRRCVPRRRLRLALRRLLDVPRHEPGHPPARRALRVDLEPQLRRTPGPRRAHSPGQPEDGRRGRDRGPLRRHPRMGAGMNAVRVIRGPISVLRRHDVDTDQIIPKQFLKRVERSGFGEFLFYDWKKHPEWELESNPILVTGRNFGCGSSREHAPWALEDFGFKAIVAPSFADIFYSNCTKIGLLPVTLAEDEVEALMEAGEAQIDLEQQSVVWDGGSASFQIDQETRRRLLNGLDDIGATLLQAEAVERYEAERERSGPVTTALA